MTRMRGKYNHYHHRLPSSRLGTRHESLASYLGAVSSDDSVAVPPTVFSLVVILSRNDDQTIHAGEVDGDGGSDINDNCHNDTTGANISNISILLGKKLRGFGSGFYNCFGGKLEPSLNEYNHPAKGAVRELEEECGIHVSLEEMEQSFVGKIHFTFEDHDVNRDMLVHLFCVFISLDKQSFSSSSSSHHVTTNDNGTDNIQSQKKNNASTVPTHAPRTIVPMTQIRGCDEIEPIWFHDIHDIPLHQMFADDSIWLTMLLEHYNDWCGGEDNSAENEAGCPTLPLPPPPKFKFDARFHFHAGGTETNSIMHYFLQHLSPTSSLPKKEAGGVFTLEQRLFHALHTNNIHSPSIKEFKENWAMANAVRTYMKDSESRMEYVLDVAGGHGALAALFLLLVPECHTAVVIDPAECNSGKFGVREAWSRFWSTNADDTNTKTDARNNRHLLTSSLPTKTKELRYRHECLRTGLRAELDSILCHAKNTCVTVVACHASDMPHLTDETLQIASEYGVNVAVMPCCQKDHDGWWKKLANGLVTNNGGGSGNGKNINATLSIGALMDILAAGKMMSWDAGLSAGVRYLVKMKLMDESISRQNRMILCKALTRDYDGNGRDRVGRAAGDRRKEMAHARLTRAYHRAHHLPDKGGSSEFEKEPPVGRHFSTRMSAGWDARGLLAGVCIGAAVSILIASLTLARKK